MFRQIIVIDPKYAPSYNGLGNALADLGHYKEAIKAYRAFIDLADKKKNDDSIKRAEDIIADLQMHHD